VRPLGVRQIAGKALATLTMDCSMLSRPHAESPTRLIRLGESQPTIDGQRLLGQALRPKVDRVDQVDSRRDTREASVRHLEW
jgi:hypothetical protein